MCDHKYGAMRIKAFAKINMMLNVLGKREDSYHEIETVFQAIDLCDIVDVSCESIRGFFEVHLRCRRGSDERIFGCSQGRSDQRKGLSSAGCAIDLSEVPTDNRNLAYRAAVAMHDTYHSRENEKITIEIEKNIPVAGGLGGGSADAAAVINALCSLWGIPISDDVYRLAAALGADVAFCLAAQTGSYAALARGVGEELSYFAPGDFELELMICDDKIPNKTANVYKKFDELFLSGGDQKEICSGNAAMSPAALRKYGVSEIGNQLQPALEAITGKAHPDWVLCGAGPTYFRIKNENCEYAKAGDIEGTIISVHTMV